MNVIFRSSGFSLKKLFLPFLFLLLLSLSSVAEGEIRKTYDCVGRYSALKEAKEIAQLLSGNGIEDVKIYLFRDCSIAVDKEKYENASSLILNKNLKADNGEGKWEVLCKWSMEYELSGNDNDKIIKESTWFKTLLILIDNNIEFIIKPLTTYYVRVEISKLEKANEILKKNDKNSGILNYVDESPDVEVPAYEQKKGK